MRECGHYLEMILSAQMAFEMSFRLKFAVTVSAPRTAKSQTFGVLMATTLYVLPKTDTAVARYFADLAEKVQFWFLRLTPFLAKLFELERHSLFLSNFEGAFLLWKPVQAGAQGCSNNFRKDKKIDSNSNCHCAIRFARIYCARIRL
jgi:hypothetical protein